jgi:hypothetical protein
VIGLWLASLLGAAAFGAAGFFLARMLAAKAAADAPARVDEAPKPPPAADTPRADERETPPETPAAPAFDHEAAVAAATEEAEEKVRQKLEALREELRVEILARTEAERRASDLASRLVSSGQQVTALRAKIAIADEAKRSGQHAAVRHQTQPPPRVSERPPPPARMQSLAPGLFSEIEELRREVARLTAENRSLKNRS